MYKRTFDKGVVENIWGVDCEVPDMPPKEEIFGYGLPPEKQKHRKTELPNNFGEWYSLPPEEQHKYPFVAQEWNRRLNGFWFYNNGKPTYITGPHYFYLNYWRIDIGLPEYRDSDRKFFMAWDHCVRDRSCLGMIYIKNRREGATYRAGCLMFEAISRARDAQGGIQSKTKDDAAAAFKKAVSRPFEKMVGYADFFRPVISGQTKGMRKLVFDEPGQVITLKKLQEAREQGRGYDIARRSSALGSEIHYGSSKEEEYDGYKLTMYWGDEIGKTTESNVAIRHDIVRECLMDSGKIVGKMLLTSTVEEMEKRGGKFCKQIWDDSTLKMVPKVGENLSGLIRVFKPAYEGYKGADGSGMDEFGNSNVDQARKMLNKRRKALRDKGDSAKLAAFLRKYPFTPEEAFIPDSRHCHFDTLKLAEQIARINAMVTDGEPPFVRGNFVWRMGEYPTGRTSSELDVVWQPNPEGRWLLSRDGLPDEKIRNKCYAAGNGLWTPANKSMYVMGVDPYDFSDVERAATASKGAGAVLKRANPLDPDDGSKFVCLYAARPATNKIFYEDMIKTAVFYGCGAVIESNKPRCLDHFIDRGFRNYIYGKLRINKTKKPSNTPEKGGNYTVRSTKVAMVEALDAFIYEHYQKVDFLELLYDWRDFEIDKSQKYDITMASGLAVLGDVYVKRDKPEDEKPQTTEFVQRYTVDDSNQSVPI